MATAHDPNVPLDRTVVSLRVSLAVIKSHAQLLARRQWELSDADRAHLTERLAIIDAHVGHAADLLTDLLEETDRMRSPRTPT